MKNSRFQMLFWTTWGKTIRMSQIRSKGRTLLALAMELDMKVDMDEGVQTWIVSWSSVILYS